MHHSRDTCDAGVLSRAHHFGLGEGAAIAPQTCPPNWWVLGGNRAVQCGALVFKRVSRKVEAAGIEPASEAASPGISTSVSRILVLAWRLLPTGSASASRGVCPASEPRRPRSGNPVYVTPFSSPPD